MVVIVWCLDLQLPVQSGRWFSPSTPVSSTNETGRHDITEILLKVTLNTINLNLINTYRIFRYERNV